MVLTLAKDNINVLKWYVGAAYTVQSDMRGHTGACLTIGKRAIYCKSTKQKLNTKHSTQSELVGVDDMLP